MKRSFLLLFSLLICLVAKGQYNLERTYSSADGFPITELKSVAKDGLGYLWVFDTRGEAFRFDGVSFHHFAFPGTALNQTSGLLQVYAGWVMVHNANAPKNHFRIFRGGEARLLDQLPPGSTPIIAPDFPGILFLHLKRKELYRYRGEELAFEGIFPADSLEFLADLKQPGVFQNGSLEEALHADFPLATLFFLKEDRLYGILRREGIQTWPAQSQTHFFIRYPSGRLQLRDLRGEVLAENTLPASPEGRDGFFEQLGKWYHILEKPAKDKAGIKREIDLDEVVLKNEEIHLEPIARFPQKADIQSVPWIDDSPWIWKADHSGLRQINRHIKAFKSGENNMIYSLHAIGEAADGSVYMGGYGTGMVHYKEGELHSVATLPTDFLPGNFEDDNGNLYFLLERSNITPQNLLRIDSKGEKKVYPLKNSIGESLSGYHFSSLKLPACSPILNKRGASCRDTLSLFAISTVARRVRGVDNPYGHIVLGELPWTDPPKLHFIDYHKGIRLGNILCSVQDRAGRIWFGHAQTGIGCYSPQLDSAVTWGREKDEDPGAIDMAIDPQGYLWMGDKNGLTVIPGAGSIALDGATHLRKFAHRLRGKGIPNQIISSVEVVGETLIMGHNDGFYFLDLNKFHASGGEEFDIRHFNTLNINMGRAEQNAILADRSGHLWLGCDQGALQMDYRAFLQDQPLPQFSDILIGGDRDSLQPVNGTVFMLPKSDRTLEYSFQLPPRHQLHGRAYADILLLDRKNDTLEFDRAVTPLEVKRRKKLDPGQYELQFLLFQDNKMVDERIIRVSAPAHVYEQAWFIPALIFVALGIIITLLILQNQASKERAGREAERAEKEKLGKELERQQKEQESLRVAALISTLNPHFITNVLQWIQSSVRQNADPDRISAITDRLGSNVRTMFVNSYERRAGHPLRKELELVRNYLETVNMQYEERYTFKLPPQDTIDRLGDYKVLLLQLQVHVENAVDHGLRNRREAEKVEIRIEDDTKNIYLTIEDDGAGFTRAAATSQVGARKGMKMMEDLQAIFNHKNDYPIITEIDTDLQPEPDGSGKRFGTRITVTVPKNYSYELENDRS